MYSGLLPIPATLPRHPLNRQLVVPFEEKGFLGLAMPPHAPSKSMTIPKNKQNEHNAISELLLVLPVFDLDRKWRNMLDRKWRNMRRLCMHLC
jgi:hypothetical protein